jgi:hypothetical protein
VRWESRAKCGSIVAFFSLGPGVRHLSQHLRGLVQVSDVFTQSRDPRNAVTRGLTNGLDCLVNDSLYGVDVSLKLRISAVLRSVVSLTAS